MVSNESCISYNANRYPEGTFMLPADPAGLSLLRSTRKRKYSVLIADASPAWCDLVRFILTDTEFEVIGVASTLMESLDMMSRLHPEVTLLDNLLAHSYEVDLLTLIFQEQHKMPVILCTGSGDWEDIVSAMNGGAAGYCLKSMARSHLLHALRAIRAGARAVVTE